MRIAVGIIGIMAGLLVLLQSCAVTVGSNLTGDTVTSQAGAAGVLIGCLFFIGGAFAFSLPTVSVAVFVAAAIAGFAGASDGKFGDLQFWAYGALILAVLSFLARRTGRRQAGKRELEETPR